MKIHSIKYSNYRCFRDLTLSFNTNKDKNIALIVAPNGGGKTEMLFSFWWVLYGFNFSTLKGKESTAYALNSALYHDLNNSVEDKTASCSVELTFESEGNIYTVTRIEKYEKKQKKGISITPSINLSIIKQNGESSLPIEDVEEVERYLNSIIPQQILSGILFDGERMKQLSSTDAESKNAVEGVIKHITNQELFVMCGHELNDLHNSILKESRKVCKDTNDSNLERILEKISITEAYRDEASNKLESAKKDLIDIEEKLGLVYRELEQHQDSQKYELQRKELRESKAEYEKSLEKAVNAFFVELNFGHRLITKKLLETVTDLIQNEDLPGGLTAEAVESILKQKNCICGKCLEDEDRKLLKALVTRLPPRNINSTIQEMARHVDLDAGETKVKLLEASKNIEEIESSIVKKKEEIDRISSMIADGASERIKELEQERKKLETQKDRLQETIEKSRTSIAEYEKILDFLYKTREKSDRNDSALKHLIAKDNFTQKCLKAIRTIEEINKKESLKHINNKINDAYAILSEDFENSDKRIYIVQFDKVDQYGMVLYHQKQYNATYAEWKSNGTLASLQHQGKGDDEIKELIILNIRESSSTGQSKINTLSFAKAILDYSSEARDAESTQLSKSYPFLIDSPFTELSNGNLDNAGKNIHLFAEQLILLASPDSLAKVNHFLEPNIACFYEFEKGIGESNCSLKV